MATTNAPVTLDTLIVVKIQLQGQGSTRRFKVPLRDLGANVFPDKVRRAVARAARERCLQLSRFQPACLCRLELPNTSPQLARFEMRTNAPVASTPAAGCPRPACHLRALLRQRRRLRHP